MVILMSTSSNKFLSLKPSTFICKIELTTFPLLVNVIKSIAPKVKKKEITYI